MLQVILFVTLFIFSFAVDSPAACQTQSSSYNIQSLAYSGCHYGSTCAANGYGNDLCINKQQCQQNLASCPSPIYKYNKYLIPTDFQQSSNCSETSSGCVASGGAASRCYYKMACDTRRDADSAICVKAGKQWITETGTCYVPPPPPDTTFHCQDAGGPVPGGFGGPRVAKLFRCVDGVCENTRDLSGSCSDWGFCGEGVSDCDIPDSLSCGRSGSRFITSSRCVYACADGSSLSCQPVSTGYVAGNIYAGECPSSPPPSCRPGASSSSSSGLLASSGSVLPASSATDWRDTLSPDSPPLDYTAILAAIHDTLHHANEQRDFVLNLENNINLDLDNISNYSEFNYQQLSNINSKLSGGVPLRPSLDSAISFTPHLLDDINKYLHSDTALFNRPDTTYNPLLRDIKSGLDSVVSRRDSSIFARDTVWAKWWSNYLADSASSRGLVGQALGAIVDNMKDNRDSARAADCDGYLGCMSVYKDIGYCRNAWGVGASDCVSGGTPFDGIWNTEVSILETVWDFMFGDSTADFTPQPVTDTIDVEPPAMSGVVAAISSASAALDSADVQGLLSHVLSLVDSAQRARGDSVKVQPDSLSIDSATAAGYASNIMFPGGTSNDCFVCHADLGDFGGLADSTLSIHIDFSNFGGFDWCALVRAVVKIATLVICISLTLGSWMAAFGYNPNNDV